MSQRVVQVHRPEELRYALLSVPPGHQTRHPSARSSAVAPPPCPASPSAAQQGAMEGVARQEGGARVGAGVGHHRGIDPVRGALPAGPGRLRIAAAQRTGERAPGPPAPVWRAAGRPPRRPVRRRRVPRPAHAGTPALQRLREWPPPLPAAGAAGCARPPPAPARRHRRRTRRRAAPPVHRRGGPATARSWRAPGGNRPTRSVRRRRPGPGAAATAAVPWDRRRSIASWQLQQQRFERLDPASLASVLRSSTAVP